MKRKQLINRAEQIMQRYALRDLEGENRVEMKTMIHRFFSDRVHRLSRQEVMDRMSTPMRALAWFNGYLCDTWRRRCCTGSAANDACTMS